MEGKNEMYLGSQHQFALNTAKLHLGHRLKGVLISNGTSAADAVASVLEVDRRLGGSDRTDELELCEVASVNLAFDIINAIESGHSRVELPFGTLLETKAPGDIEIGGETWILDAGRPGLHPIETTSSAAHGPNLELLHHHIARLTRRLACRRLGLPHPVFVSDGDDRHLLQFKPLPEAGGAVLQRWADGTKAPRFCSALSKQIEDFAAEIVKDMRTFWKRRKDIALQAAEVRAIAEARVENHHAEVEAVIVDLSYQSNDAELDMYVHYIGIDVALRRGLVLDYIPAHMREHRRLNPLCAPGQDEERQVLRGLGADAWISGAAAAILSSEHVDRNAILSALSTSYECTFAIPTAKSPIYSTLYWHLGEIRAFVTMHAGLSWNRDRLELFGVTLPEVVSSSATGRPISTFADLPFGGDLIVKEVETLDWGVRLHIEEQELLIDLASGKVWHGAS